MSGILTVDPTWLVGFGLVLWLGVPMIERKFGLASANTVFLSGLLTIIAAVIVDYLSGTIRIGSGGTLGIAVLGWAVVTYFIFRTARNGISAKTGSKGSQSGGGTAQGQCVPKLRQGTYTLYKDEASSWRTHLGSYFECNPSDTQIEQEAWADGTVWYGIWTTKGDAEATPKVQIFCDQTTEGKCGAGKSEKGKIEESDGPVRVSIKNVIEVSGDTVTLVSKMGSALSASGGPSISVSAGPISIGMSFPDASHSFVYAMGSYVWRCETA